MIPLMPIILTIVRSTVFFKIAFDSDFVVLCLSWPDVSRKMVDTGGCHEHRKQASVSATALPGSVEVYGLGFRV